MQKVLSFKDDDKELILFLDNKKLCYGKKIKSKISYDLDTNEIKLIKKVLRRFLPSDYLIDMGEISFENKKIKTYFDYESGRYHFYHNEKLPTLDEFIKLNKMYNQREEFVYEDSNDDLDKDFLDSLDDENSKEDYILEKIKVGEKYIKVIFSLTLIYLLNFILINYGPTTYGALSYQAKNKILNAIERVTDFSSNDLTSKKVIETINQNPNLTEEEKEFYLRELDFIEDQAPYIDQSDFLDTISKLDIVYNQNASDDKNVGGSWNKEYRVNIYATNGYSNASKIKLRHELYHTVTQKEAIDDSKNTFVIPFYEILNRQMGNEYEGGSVLNPEAYDSSYAWLEEYFYRIARLFKPETLRKFHAVPNHEYLISELVEIIKDVDKAYQLFDALYQYDHAYKAIEFRHQKLLEIKSLTDWEETLRESRQKLDSLIKEYYDAKFKDVSNYQNDLEYIYLYDKTLALKMINEDINYKDEFSYMKENSYIVKGPNYFNLEDTDFVIAIPRPWNEIIDENGNLIEEQGHDFYYYDYSLKEKRIINQNDRKII